MATLRGVAFFSALLLSAVCMAGTRAGPKEADDLLRQNPQIRKLQGIPHDLRGDNVQDCPAGGAVDLSRSRCVVAYVPNTDNVFVFALYPNSRRVWIALRTDRAYKSSVFLGAFDQNGTVTRGGPGSSSEAPARHSGSGTEGEAAAPVVDGKTTSSTDAKLAAAGQAQAPTQSPAQPNANPNDARVPNATPTGARDPDSGQTQPNLVLGVDGLGPARIGMNAARVEQAIGSPLQVAAERRKTKTWLSSECTVGAPRLPGVSFVFDHDRLTAVLLAEPSRLSTRQGVAVGDAERKATAALRSDPTFARNVSRYDDGSNTFTELSVGRATFDQRSNAYLGSIMRFSAKKGTITSIQAGLARYVAVDEHEGSGGCE
jgi:hypothetical protein